MEMSLEEIIEKLGTYVLIEQDHEDRFKQPVFKLKKKKDKAIGVSNHLQM